MSEPTTVQVTCQGAGTLHIGDIHPFQKELKTLTKENYAKLKHQILELGFSEPISVWEKDGKYYCLNGHQRLRALTMMAQEGFVVPEIPVNFIDAKNTKEAKLKILSLTSQYGDIDQDGLYEFLCDAQINPQEFLAGSRLVTGDFDGMDFIGNYFIDNPPEDKKNGIERKPMTCPECGHVF